MCMSSGETRIDIGENKYLVIPRDEGCSIPLITSETFQILIELN